MSTLYVTDLDGTLMRSDQALSRYTVETVNRLIEEGMLITYATARLFQSAHGITKEIHFNLPVITRNGTAFVDPVKKKETEILQFSKQDVNKLRMLLGDQIKRLGFVTSYIDGEMVKLFDNGEISEGLKEFLGDTNDKRIREIRDDQDIFAGTVTYCTLIANKRELQPLYEKVKNAGDWECVFSKDTYGEDYWLEICPLHATKAKAIMKYKEKMGFDRVVVFGDSVNDISMFEIADESYAVENAIDELKEIATSVIASNDQDGVATFLSERWEKEKLGMERSISHNG